MQRWSSTILGTNEVLPTVGIFVLTFSIEIGVHGQSLGGAVACYLARHCNMDFVFIDRSFSSIDKVVERSYGRFLQYSLKFLTFFSWEFEATKNYIFANTYKVIGCDPKDELIPDDSSLKNGVTREIILAEVTRKEQRISTGPNKRREAKYIDFDHYCHIINKEETQGFYDAMKYLYDMILGTTIPLHLYRVCII